MKRRYVILLFVFIVIIAAVWFFVFRQAGRYHACQAIPKGSVFVVETPSFNSVHESLQKNKIWSSLKGYPAFEEYHKDLEYADSICNAHPVLKRMIADRPFAMSCHSVSADNFDFLFVCDLGKLNVIKAFEGFLTSLPKEYKVEIRRKGDINELTVNGTDLFYVIKANLLIVSFSENLVRQSFVCCEQAAGKNQNALSGDVSFDIDHKELNKWMNYMFQVTQQPGDVSSSFQATRLALDLTDKSLLFEGETTLDHTSFSLLSALNLMNGGESKVKKIVSGNTAAYVSFCFESFPELKEVLLENYKIKNLKEYNEYQQTLDKVNKYLRVDVLELFTSWIGGEITIIKPAVDKENRLDNLAVAIRSKNIDFAKDQLGYLSEQIERKTPVRFRSLEYNGHTINYLGLKGFFSLFLSSMFNKFDRPYYTFIEDYVVFSNSSATLAGMIKDYSLGNTLGEDEKYCKLIGEFGGGNNVYGYVNMPDMYDYLYESLEKPDARQDFTKNKGAFLSFEIIGFAMVNSGEGFKTRIIANHNVNAPDEYAVKELNRELEDLCDEIESGYYYPSIPDSIAVSTRGNYAYKTDRLSFSGALCNGDPHGIWNVDDKQGGRLAQLIYNEGKLDGESRFFYNNGTVKAQVSYDEGKITAYKEFFQDGALKMEIEYNRGVRHGDIRFYYSTGHLRGEGKYRKGRRTGTWKYYRVTGEADRKMKF